jgi:tetratricopeptide (TPR) repeat protein
LGDPLGLAEAMCSLGQAHVQTDPAVARPLLEESLATYRQLDDKRRVAYALFWLGTAQAALGDYTGASSAFRESLELRLELGDNGLAASSRTGLASALRDLGYHATARDMLVESLAEARQARVTSQEARVLAELCEVALDQGDIGRAQSMLREALALEREISRGHRITQLVECAAGLAIAQGQAKRALRLVSAAAVQREVMHASPSPAHQVRLDVWVASARQALGHQAAASACASGRAMSQEEAIADALSDSPD